MHCLEIGQILIYNIKDLLRKSVVFACAQQLIVFFKLFELSII
jgi:hypothetical protein